MAIKRRTNEADREAAIAAFAAGAAGENQAKPEPDVVPAPSRALFEPVASTARVGSAPVPRAMLLRFSDEELPALLEQVAKAEKRSKHNMALIALRRGLDAMRSELE